MFCLRGFQICAETIRQWVLSSGIFLAKKLRKKRYGKAGNSWYVDETYVTVNTIDFDIRFIHIPALTLFAITFLPMIYYFVPIISQYPDLYLLPQNW
jgi:predicted cation transporter